MLAIRLQRLGRKGYPTYRIAVQEAQRHPSSGRVVAYVGSYNPHTKETSLTTEKVDFYLKNGARPTPRVVRILEDQKVKLPDWVVKHSGAKKVSTKNAEKLRKNQPKEEKVEEAVEEPVVDLPTEEAEQPETATEEKQD
ncbi:MAG: 30S ribosomal protein S16 [Candidatus Saccharimonadales bacterium]